MGGKNARNVTGSIVATPQRRQAKDRSGLAGEPSLERFERVDRRRARSARAHPCGGRSFAVLMRACQGASERSRAGEVERTHPWTIGTLEQPLPRGGGCRVTAQQDVRRWTRPFFEGDQQRRNTGRPLPELAGKRAQRALCGVEVTRLAQPVAEREERLRSDTVARRRRIVVRRLGPMDQRLVVVAGEKEAAARRILEPLEQGFGDFDRPGQILRPERRLQELEQCGEQI